MTTEGTVKFNMSFEWRDMSWHDKAACLGVDVEVFYIPDSMRGPSKQAHIYKAKNYCRVSVSYTHLTLPTKRIV